MSNFKNNRFSEKHSPLGRVYAFILSWEFPDERKAEPAATDLGRESAAGSEDVNPSINPRLPNVVERQEHGE